MNLTLVEIGNGNQKAVMASFFKYTSFKKSIPSITIIIY